MPYVIILFVLSSAAVAKMGKGEPVLNKGLKKLAILANSEVCQQFIKRNARESGFVADFNAHQYNYFECNVGEIMNDE